MTTNSFEDERCLAIADNLERIRAALADAAAAAGRSENSVELMAVTKTVPVEYINYSIDRCGVDLIGENKVQEFLQKQPLLHLDGVRKHLIGHLQTNKVRKILPAVDMIQSVDSLHLAQKISDEAAALGVNADILLELNIDAEQTKTGFSEEAFASSLAAFSELPNITVRGLMTVPPLGLPDSELERYFDGIHQRYESLKAQHLPGFDLQILSMGMSGDFALAVKHGSTQVRIGSAIYGARIYH